ncbi:cyclopropane-fatty-acyl-phospholipid synthase family protein [Luteimonas sp. 50]|uniref:Cyclopropane-fatty-acyl-phospholipid synthase family protein n=1 Tax=Cognatiluteimonas sedimenti TaxID=2927791 RepID=A0ABT0A166_9GAMM|nr:cyclopropane-fatty-acyl-phospholipid synthase family protein [Lysobacter sedimenti]MCJ0824717.1 cyclopropane-fatty-acyl-phospholipid synthase family protein [Lysobacter sedimenti]
MTSIVRPVASTAEAAPGAMDRFLRGRLLGRLAKLRGGELELTDALGTVRVGEAGAAVAIRLQVHGAGFYRALAGNGSIGAAEAFMDGEWDCSDLVGLVRLLVRNRNLLDAMERGPARLGGLALRGWNAMRRNTRAGARRNIAAHYDLGNPFFRLFLSEDLMYSSAIYAGADDTLEAASTRKLDRICEKLQLTADDHVVEIGTGWGGFAVHAARSRGCRVTTTTISREQHALAQQRVAEAGLQERVTVLLSDYRDLQGRYDKLVSIEMIEAIGAQYLETYFATMGRLLKPDGLALVQAITIEDHRYRQALRSVDFIKRHVFPGSFIPSITAMLDAKTRSTDLALLHLEDFGSSYARTLNEWRRRFLGNRDAIREQGHDERFLRMWEFYLAYCEGGFLERSIGVAHLLLAKPGYRGEPYLPGLLEA